MRKCGVVRMVLVGWEALVRACDTLEQENTNTEAADELMYSSTDCDFNLSSEDVRVASMVYKQVEVRRSSRASVVSKVKTITLEKKCYELLKLRSFNPLDW